ncbi:MAG: hypothetical protein COS34_11720 [Lysobacterales bacterium CG02_land_8_20_14_3_00_62_12]|nr:MAG: hypothetical protein COS34_11720 [Xanthomonadales bacterium CG02_land_8_20_14_3_00_62_12]PJA42385.1 MAG: hypothetical protein CO182_02760 [Xanthomonadales bacterium CG_4_9_14_3_um_filter_62_6]
MAAVLAISLLALLATARCGLPPAPKVGLALLVLIACWRATRQLRSPPLQRAQLQADGSWLLLTAAGECPAHLLEFSILGKLIGLRWHLVDRRGRLSLLLWPDSVSTEAQRRLRIWLHSARPPAAANDPRSAP